MNKLVLIDGNAILHRAFHALPPSLTTPDGQPTNAVYGFVAILLRVIEELKPTHLAVAFDRAKPTFRKTLFKEYQAHRPKMEDALVSQVDIVHRVVTAMKMPIFEQDGFEADDLLGSIAKQVGSSQSAVRSKKIDDTVIVTGDRDLLQLVNHQVKLFMPVKGLTESKLFGEKEAQERMGVVPKLIPDLKALMGDASDNYPGVAGIGPKTAVALLNQFGSVEKLYQHLDQVVNPSVREKLEKDRDNAMLSHKLATVVTDAPIKFVPEKAQLAKDLLTQEVIELFGNLGFKTLLKRMGKMMQKEVPGETKPIKKKDERQMELF
ncbi:MAG: polymerase I protein [Candidatus Gottesmanbacteria bacterium GW2011_GWB1_43_11]|uniref:Polymerase I protein n=1 Tax=Candidatus Gottesmanbacteria bacterium GW2011_GWB1_43_11 TaxID=1618446 RepID=A0A0G1FLC6_9BACT|nr:MAG: polymerase I protein [Candidatus Gottesmanbacteria bacterium GW2011_GWA2_42_16]KKS81614.1 MAG: polymerase I protein [Candidatus Gottesmanbacteria bacterium GW2011_GWC1_43_10]KKS87703.1 MAG: polymerase I protein [Candidatus Gottesmanbacteria bacterium GW2011_GWB1_43_11]OGG28252.1 MAG: hypothetical protein A3A59_01730 [Candidatus Gottesmanbacteria bacterium RIFCSPLOWO2_01_FULL_42_10]HCM37462.1 hypothetical protein [Patescibacteria group bacterium]